MSAVLFLGVLIVASMIGIPVAYGLIISAGAVLSTFDMFTVKTVAQQVVGGMNSFTLLAMPFFILSGEIMNESGISQRIVNFVSALFGHVRGSLGYITVICCMIFAGLSGSALADTVCLGSILIPLMIADGYTAARATGLVVCSGIIANYIPPSIGMILYGVSSGNSITDLFIGGLIPGIIFGLGIMVTWYFICRKDGITATHEKKSAKEVWKVLKESIWALILPIIIVVGLRCGIFTPTEGGAVAAAYALFVGMVVYRTISFKQLVKVFKSTVKTTASVMFICGASMIASWAISIGRVPQTLVELCRPLIARPTLLMIIFQLVFLVMGMFLDVGPNILILTPILLPIVKEAGINTIYFGVLMVINLTFGEVTPPVGIGLYAASGISKIDVMETVRGALPFIIAEIVMIFIFAAIPQIIEIPLALLT